MNRFIRRDWRNVTIGLLAGLCLALSFGAAGDGSDRFRLHVWSADPSEGGHAAAHGAFRIDTVTGDVHRITGTTNKGTRIEF